MAITALRERDLGRQRTPPVGVGRVLHRVRLPVMEGSETVMAVMPDPEPGTVGAASGSGLEPHGAQVFARSAAGGEAGRRAGARAEKVKWLSGMIASLRVRRHDPFGTLAISRRHPIILVPCAGHAPMPSIGRWASRSAIPRRIPEPAAFGSVRTAAYASPAAASTARISVREESRTAPVLTAAVAASSTVRTGCRPEAGAAGTQPSPVRRRIRPPKPTMAATMAPMPHFSRASSLASCRSNLAAC